VERAEISGVPVKSIVRYLKIVRRTEGERSKRVGRGFDLEIQAARGSRKVVRRHSSCRGVEALCELYVIWMPLFLSLSGRTWGKALSDDGQFLYALGLGYAGLEACSDSNPLGVA
jgi:hypothetical protein